MVTLAFALIAYVRAFFVSRHKLALKAVALRQQLASSSESRPVPNCGGLFVLIDQAHAGVSAMFYRILGAIARSKF